MIWPHFRTKTAPLSFDRFSILKICSMILVKSCADAPEDKSVDASNIDNGAYRIKLWGR